MTPGRGWVVQERLAECSWGGRGNARVSCPTRSRTRGELGNELTPTNTLASVSSSVKWESNCAALLRIRRNKQVIMRNTVRTVPGAWLTPVSQVRNQNFRSLSNKDLLHNTGIYA